MIVERETEVYCDICGRRIQDISFGSILMGRRYTVRSSIFDKPKSADFCDDCVERIRNAQKTKGANDDIASAD